jgi:hypothetical protein
MKTPAYYRARIQMMRDLQTTLGKSESEAQRLNLVRNGVFVPKNEEDEAIDRYLKENQYPPDPLSFSELCTYNTWFQIHPEKVCGVEVFTSSRDFPITIKGNRETIENTIRKSLKKTSNQETSALLELEALALELELQLLNL